MQFANREDGERPQKLHIRWTMETPRDDTASAPDEMDDGFWPSLDPEAAGWIGDNPEKPFEVQQAEAESRMVAWRDDKWEYVGVVARADILLPIGGGSFRMMSFRSVGLWGIESDAGDYLRQMFEEEKDALRSELIDLGERLKAGEAIEEDA